jgi:ADP-heptose:LPS heptosyltransferase
MAGALKEKFPECTILFLGKEYTRQVIACCRFVDEFVNWDEAGKELQDVHARRKARATFLSSLHADVIIHVFPVREICSAAKTAGIPLRIATARRFFTWFTCNRKLHIPRRNSDLHEAQLNLKMLKPLGIKEVFPLWSIPRLYGFSDTPRRFDKTTSVDPSLINSVKSAPAGYPDGSFPWLKSGKYNLILHPKSKGSAREWGLDNFSALIRLLPEEKFNVLVTGTAGEGERMRAFLDLHKGRITDLTGKLDLAGLISMIARCDGMVAASTGPLHLAAALGIRAIGLYAPMRPVFPLRWAPVGEKACYLVIDKKCNDCRKTLKCHCIQSITPESVALKLTTSGI